MKKILFILPSLGVGGLERVQVTLANALVRHGYGVTVMVLSNVTDLADELDERVHFVYKPLKKHIGNRIPYIRSRFFDDGMWETRASARQLYDYYVGNDNYDVEIAFFRGMPIKIISGSSNIASVKLAWVHNDFLKATGYKNNFRSLKDVYNAYASYDHVICVSIQAAEGFRTAIGDTGNITTVYNMLPIERIRKLADEESQLNIKKTKLHLVIVARLLDSAKGQVRLINTVCRLYNEGADISLAIVGGGADYQMLQKLITDNHAGSYIDLAGEQRNPYPYINEADLLVCASYFEGYNLTVAEALILGVPVLSTDCTGPNEILDNGNFGMIVENSEEGLYNGLKRFADNPDLLNAYKEKALKRQDFFDEEKILMQITDLF